MKKVFVSLLFSVALFTLSFSHEDEHPSGHGGPMDMHHGMGMSMIPDDPQTRQLVMEHMRKCRQELMMKLMRERGPQMAERMLMMMSMHPEAFKKALENNPQLKKKLKELLNE